MLRRDATKEDASRSIINLTANLPPILNELPNGFPPAPDRAELRLLAYLFTPEEAALAAQLRLMLDSW